MKKIVLTLVAAIMMGSAAMAQDDNNQPRRPHKKVDKTEMTQKRTSEMAERYGLDKKQTEKLQKLNTEYAGKLGPQRGGMGPRPAGGPRPGFGKKAPGEQPKVGKSESECKGDCKCAEKKRPQRDPEAMKKRHEEMKARRQAYDARLKEIMTDEQFKQYEADKAARRAPRHKH